MARGKRTRLATGLYEDAYGRTVVVKVHGIQHERRYAPGTPIDDLRRYRRELKDEWRDTPAQTKRGTLRAPMQAFLDQYPKDSTERRNVRILIDHWIAAGVGDLAPGEVTPARIAQQLAAWDGRFAPKTLNDLRRVLAGVFSLLNGKAGANPVRDVKRQRVIYDDPRGQDYRLIALILRQMPDRGRPPRGQARPTINLTKLRLRAMAYTGLHQIELSRLTPRDLRDLAHARIWVVGRRKGAGTEGGWHPLTSQGVKALRALQDAGDIGQTISTSAMSKSWRRAVEKAKAVWARWARRYTGGAWPAPDNLRPYDLRHSYGSEVYRQTGDIRAAQRLLRNRTLTPTLRYTQAAVDPQALRAAQALEQGWLSASRVPAGTGKVLPNPPPTAQSHRGEAGTEKRPETTTTRKIRPK